MKLNDLKLLSRRDMDMIHDTSISILEETGVLIYSQSVLKLLEQNGAIVDYEKRLAKLPAKLVEFCIKTLPKTFELYDRDLKKSMIIGDGIPKCASGHNAIFVIDADTYHRRNSTVKDVENFGIVSDKLEDIDIVGVPVMPQDVSNEASLLYAVKALYETTTKPLFYSTESSSVNAAIIKIMKVIAGKDDISECPNAISQLSPTSPLFWEEGAVDATVETAKEGIPLNLLPCPISGISAPYTVAGLLAVHNTEILSGVVISQLVRKGTPVIYGSSWVAYDMKFSNAIIGSPETSMLRIAACQMARYYNMPSHTTAPNSDSNLHDEQNAWEKAISNMSAICAGNDIVMNSGMFATGLTISLEQLILDDEMNGIIRRLYRGIDINKETIGRNVIKSVGPRGNFMIQEHTFDYLRSEEFREVKVSNTKNYDEWLSDGAPDVARNAKRVVEKILAKGNCRVLDNGKIKMIDEIIKEFEKNIK